MTSEFPATRGAPPPEIPPEVLRRLALLGGLWPPRSLRKCSGGWRSSGGSAPEIPLEVLRRLALLGGLWPPRSPWKCSGGWRSSGGSGPRDPPGSAPAVGAPRGAPAPEIPPEVLRRLALLGGLRPPRSPRKCSPRPG